MMLLTHVGHVMYYEDLDVDIDGRDSNGNWVGGYGGGCYSGEEESYRWDNSTSYKKPSPLYKYQFTNEEDLITSEIFQKHLGMTLTHKDKIIRELQEEILNGK